MGEELTEELSEEEPFHELLQHDVNALRHVCGLRHSGVFWLLRFVDLEGSLERKFWMVPRMMAFGDDWMRLESLGLEMATKVLMQMGEYPFLAGLLSDIWIIILRELGFCSISSSWID